MFHENPHKNPPAFPKKRGSIKRCVNGESPGSCAQQSYHTVVMVALGLNIQVEIIHTMAILETINSFVQILFFTSHLLQSERSYVPKVIISCFKVKKLC